ncbi:hypothetical protein MRX96_004529 [Rhipicephalus microplus]
MAKTVFSKLKTLWRKQSQSVQAAEAIKAALGRHLPVLNATRLNLLFNAMKYVNECKAMYAVTKVLDILQGEQYMYMGVLQPTLQSLLWYQRSLPPLKYCTPLASSLQDAVKKRFSRISEDADLALAATVHSKFKLFWMTEARKAATIRLLEEECQALEAIFNENAAASEGTDEDDCNEFRK